MGKQIVYTQITPLPSNVPRLLAVDLLHSHKEFMQLNPLVTGLESIDPPRNAASDEYFSNWYDITEVITWGFGLKKKISFQGCFHDQPYGLQTHIFAPMGTEMRNKYTIGGNQPGEPRESREIGVNTPLDGLYLREDININCSVGLTAGFVKKEFKQASQALFDRIIRKAELLDEGKLHAMFEDGKLKTSKPSDRPTFEDRPLPSPGSPPGSPPPLGSPRFSMISENTPPLDQKGFGLYRDVARNSSVRSSAYIPGYQQPGYNGPQDQYSQRPGSEQYGQPGGPQSFISELPGEFYQPNNNGLVPKPLGSGNQMSFRAELPGDSGTLQPPPVQYDRKPTPPSATHPAYQMHRDSQGAGSPQPSPGLNSQFSQDSNRLSASQPSNSPNPNNGQRSSYQVTNPDTPSNAQAGASSSNPSPNLSQGNRQSSHSSVQEWRQSVQNDTPIDANYYRNGRPAEESATSQLPSQQQRHLSNESDSQGGYQPYRNSGQQQRGSNLIQPDHQRFSNLSIQQSANEDEQSKPREEGGTSKCPVCGLFEGDATAVSHHVTKAHFQ